MSHRLLVFSLLFFHSIHIPVHACKSLFLDPVVQDSQEGPTRRVVRRPDGTPINIEFTKETRPHYWQRSYDLESNDVSVGGSTVIDKTTVARTKLQPLSRLRADYSEIFETRTDAPSSTNGRPKSNLWQMTFHYDMTGQYRNRFRVRVTHQLAEKIRPEAGLAERLTVEIWNSLDLQREKETASLEFDIKKTSDIDYLLEQIQIRKIDAKTPDPMLFIVPKTLELTEKEDVSSFIRFYNQLRDRFPGFSRILY